MIKKYGAELIYVAILAAMYFFGPHDMGRFNMYSTYAEYTTDMELTFQDSTQLIDNPEEFLFHRQFMDSAHPHLSEKHVNVYLKKYVARHEGVLSAKLRISYKNKADEIFKTVYFEYDRQN